MNEKMVRQLFWSASFLITCYILLGMGENFQSTLDQMVIVFMLMIWAIFSVGAVIHERNN